MSLPGSPLTFIAALTSGQAANGGAQNDDAAALLRKHFPKAFEGRFWDALVYAASRGDQHNFDDARKAYDQRFLSTASGIYLDRKAGDDGLVRPADLGMSDQLFRQYAIEFSTGKVTQQSLLELMQIFYGADALQAFSQSAMSGPYSLSDGDDLQLLFDEKTSAQVFFHTSDFSLIAAATAAEVAAVVTRQLHSLNINAYAVPSVDPQTQLSYVRIYSSALGLASGVRVVGGSSQNTFRFPSLITTAEGPIGTTWTVTNPSPGVFRFSTISAAMGLDLNQVYAGCYVNIYGAPFAAGNRGSFPIQAVSVTYPGGTRTQSFDIKNTSGVVQSVATTGDSDVLFFVPTRSSTNAAGGRTVVVAQVSRNSLEVRLPATTAAVSRKPTKAAYLKTNAPTTVSSLLRVGRAVTLTAAGHGVTPGATAQVIVDGVVSDATAPSTIAGVPSTTGNPGTTDASLLSIWATTRASDVAPVYLHQAVTLQNNDVLCVGGVRTNTIGGVETPFATCDRFRITATTTLTGGQVQYTYNWIATASISAGVSRGAAALLQDGRVLMTGGWNGTISVNTAQLYDPAGNSWASTGNLTAARSGHTATTLADGRVFVCGGAGSDGTTTLNTSAIYDQVAGTFTAKAPLAVTRANHQAILLKTGKVLVIGGRTFSGSSILVASNGTPLSTCELYDPAGNTFTSTGRLAYTRTGHTATLLADGRVVVVGGRGTPASNPGSTPAVIDAIEIYDPSNGQWSIVERLVYPRWQHQATLLPSGVLVVSGGSTNSDGKTPDITKTEYLDTNTMQNRVAPNSLGTAVAGAVAVAVSGVALVTGGMTSGGTTAIAQMYIQASDVIGSGRLNSTVTATATDANILTYSTDNSAYTHAAAGQVTVSKAASSPAAVPGPYVFDPMAGLGITAQNSTLSTALYKNNHYTSLPVADATKFPDAPGYIVVGFGTAYQTVIAYKGRFSGTALSLDASQALFADLPANADVTWLVRRGPFVPAHPETLGAFYLTASNAGRERVSAALDDAAAAGFNINKVVVYPGDRGLGGEGGPASGDTKLSDKVAVWGSDDLDTEYAIARGEE